MARLDPQITPDPSAPPAYFGEALADAERLLKYAAETGVEVTDQTRAAVLHARAVFQDGWTEAVAAQLLLALTDLSIALRPITALSLEACREDSRKAVKSYRTIAIVLGCIIIPFSLLSFVATAISTALTKDIAVANELAVRLRSELGVAAPPSTVNQPGQAPTSGAQPKPAMPPGIEPSQVISQLQEYASTVREIYDRSKELRFLVFHDDVPFTGRVGDPETRRDLFELTPGIPDFYADRDRITATYQTVRHFAQSEVNNVSVVYGAISTCMLPVLYALLGTCAYLLRSFQDQIRTQTFTVSRANSARFVIAGIGGAVVGLFNNFDVTQGASLSPLALAFLVGYAVDVFFAFLEGLLRAFSKTTTPQQQGHTSGKAAVQTAP